MWLLVSLTDDKEHFETQRIASPEELRKTKHIEHPKSNRFIPSQFSYQ
jgi:hypothetical protein